MKRYNVDDDKIIKTCNNAKSMAQAARELKIPYNTFIRNAIRLGVYRPNQGGKGWKEAPNKTTKERFLNEILVENSPWAGKGQRIKKYLIEFKLKKEDVCEVCGQSNIWNGKPITLQIDHVNGIKTDNRIENLRIICPNCHTQTETFSSKIMPK